jgi:putative serine protease PepD
MSTENPIPAGQPEDPQAPQAVPAPPVPTEAEVARPVGPQPVDAGFFPTEELRPEPVNPFAHPSPQLAQGPQAAQGPQGAYGPFGGTAPAADASSPDASSPDASSPGTAGTPGVKTRQRPMWSAIIATAAATALVASVATAGLLGGFDQNGSTTTPASVATIGQTSNATVPISGSTSSNPDWQKVAAAVSASVVSIQVTTQSGAAEGSGVILDAAGHVLTNNHVVSGAEANTVQVTLTDGRIYDATIVGTDTTTDLAVIILKSPPNDLKPAALGDSGAVVVGDPVMAVGNPLGLANTVTTGIVSALDRPVSASESGSSRATTVVTNAIQIDAAINPGNSGGPLFDAQGRVIGITSSIATLSSTSSQSGSIGLGFAIPINLAKNIGAQLIAKGTAEHALLGVSLSDGTATADGTTRHGAVIGQVSAGSPAASAGLQVKDVVVAIDNKPVAGAESLTAYVRAMASGDQVTLTVIRGGKALDVKVTLAAATATAAASSGSDQNGNGQNGSGTFPGLPGQGQ